MILILEKCPIFKRSNRNILKTPALFLLEKKCLKLCSALITDCQVYRLLERNVSVMLTASHCAQCHCFLHLPEI